MTECDGTKLIEAVYIRYAPQLKGMAYSIVGDSNASEDIVHDCMLNTLKNIEVFETLDDKKQKAYLISAVENLSKNYLTRHKKRFIPIEPQSDYFTFFTAEENPELLAEENISHEYILEEIAKLNVRDRKAIELKYIFGMSDRNIAPILNIKENSVRMTVRRSIFRLKKQIGLIKNHESIQ